MTRPVDGAPLHPYAQLAHELDCVVGGGSHARRGGDIYGTVVRAEPDGRLHLHDKDPLTMWEQNYYRGGDDAGVTRCAAVDAPVGMTLSMAATVGLQPPQPLDVIDDRSWLPHQTVPLQMAWHAMNWHGSTKYRAMKLLRRHPWQSWPGGDLPDTYNLLDAGETTVPPSGRPGTGEGV